MPATFSQALTLCPKGYPIRRQSWAENQSIKFSKGTIPDHVIDDTVDGVPRSLFDVASGDQTMPALELHHGDAITAWTPSTVDMMAADWEALGQALPESLTPVFWPET